MATTFPCPNRSCTYLFDSSLLPPAAMVTCPICATKFPYREGQPIPSLREQNSTNQPQANDREVRSSEEPLPRKREPQQRRVVSTHYQPKSNKGSTFLMVGIFTAFILVGLFVIYNTMKNRGFNNTQRSESTVQTFEDYNFSFDTSDKKWESDSETRTNLDVNVLAYKRSNPEAWIALYAEDFKNRTPRIPEMRRRMEDRLKKYFDKDRLNLADREGDFKLGDQKAEAVEFQGPVGDSDLIYKGECLLMVYKGIGYLFFAWAPATEYVDVYPEILAARNRFSLANFRDKWAEPTLPGKIYSPVDANYQVEDRDGQWIARLADSEKMPAKYQKYAADPKDIDPNATLAFIVEYPLPKTQDTRKIINARADAIVIETEKGEGEPIEQAKRYLLDRFKKEAEQSNSEGMTTLETPKKAGVPFPNGSPAMARLISNNSEDRSLQFFIILSALEVNDKLVFVYSWTPLRNAEYMEEFMVKFASNLKKKG